MSDDFGGKVALVTGGSRGIGRAIAATLAAGKATVVVNYAGNDAAAAEAQALCERAGAARVVLRKFDIADPAACQEAVERIVGELGGLHVLVNNAGIARRASGASMSEALDGPSVLEVFDTNAVGIVRVTEAALPLLQQSDNPVVVNVSSALGSFWATHEPSRPASRFVAIAYGASKAAVSMLTVQYARACPRIKVNAVEPGITATELGGGDPGSHPGRPAALSARVVARLALIGADGPTGTFQEDDGELGW